METKMAAARETLDFGFEVKADSVDAKGFFEGYGSTFGGAPDSGNDIVARGAFARTLKNKGRNGTGIAMLWSHDPRLPIGVWHSIVEDEKGLFCKGQVHPDARPEGVPVLELMRMGSIRGLSIGYQAVKAVKDEKSGARMLQDVDLWEISPVTFPMNTRAGITGVKQILDARTPRELERSLRDAGIDHEVSKYLVKLCKAGLREAGGRAAVVTADSMSALVAELRATNQSISSQLAVTNILEKVAQIQ